MHYKGALIIVSHDRYFLDKVATVTLDLTKHSLDRYVGNYSQFVELKEQKLQTELQNYEKQQKEIAKLEDFVQKISFELRPPSVPRLDASSWKKWSDWTSQQLVKNLLI